MPIRHWFPALALLAAAPAPVLAQAAVEVHDEHGSPLGQVALAAVPCSEGATETLRVGLALLHNMTYEKARPRFREAIEADPDCLMGYWGAAMTYIHPLWPDQPSGDDLTAGAELLKAAEARREAKPVEAAFFLPLRGYYRDAAERSERERLADFAQGWAEAAERFPDDVEVRLFHALSMLVAAQGEPDALAMHTRAGEMAQAILEDIPRHPGALHYTIHAFDVPQLAPRAEEAARTYGRVIPENPHALHMTSHIFTRLGAWEESVAYNRRAAEAALRPPRNSLSIPHMFHAADYLVYALLQRGEDDEARAMEAKVRELAAELPADPHPAASYTVAAVPARVLLERQAWAEASRLDPGAAAGIPWDRLPHLEAISTFARGLGAARAGDIEIARAGLAQLETLAEQSADLPDLYDWATQVRIQHGTVDAWIRFAEGDTAGALARMQAAARLSLSHDKHGVTPGDVLPAAELHGDMLMEASRFDEALAAYQAALEQTPNRLNSLYGAGRAAEALGATGKAEHFYRRLTEQAAGESQVDRVQHAIAFLSRSP